MGKCFAMTVKEYASGIKSYGCDILNRDAFIDVRRKRGGCCMKNCAFYKEDPEQIRSDAGIYYMSEKQKIIRRKYK